MDNRENSREVLLNLVHKVLDVIGVVVDLFASTLEILAGLL